MKIFETSRFRKSFDKLSPLTKKKAKKQMSIFFKDAFHPSLKTEKLEPKERNIWSMRIDRNFRIIFTMAAPDTIFFLNVGPHDIYRKL